MQTQDRLEAIAQNTTAMRDKLEAALQKRRKNEVNVKIASRNAYIKRYGDIKN